MLCYTREERWWVSISLLLLDRPGGIRFSYRFPNRKQDRQCLRNCYHRCLQRQRYRMTTWWRRQRAIRAPTSVWCARRQPCSRWGGWCHTWKTNSSNNIKIRRSTTMVCMSEFFAASFMALDATTNYLGLSRARRAASCWSGNAGRYRGGTEEHKTVGPPPCSSLPQV